MAAIDLLGQRFGRLEVIARNGVNAYGAAMWLCRCDCGNTVTKRGSALRSNHTKSCGCLHDELSSMRITKQNTVHGMSNTRLYEIWIDMKKRCHNINHWAYSRYGERGIAVCKEWQIFEPFYKWAIANGYSDNLSIDRIDNDGNYEPSNCRWASRKVQANNKSNNVRYKYEDNNYTISELSDMFGISYQTLRSRIENYGWSVEKALTTHVRGGGKKRGAEKLSG